MMYIPIHVPGGSGSLWMRIPGAGPKIPGEYQGEIVSRIVRLVSTGRNIPLGEMYDSHTYHVYNSDRHTTREVKVKVLSEMAIVKKLPKGKL
jgi:hypothetical protein